QSIKAAGSIQDRSAHGTFAVAAFFERAETIKYLFLGPVLAGKECQPEHRARTEVTAAGCRAIKRRGSVVGRTRLFALKGQPANGTVGVYAVRVLAKAVKGFQFPLRAATVRGELEHCSTMGCATESGSAIKIAVDV